MATTDEVRERLERVEKKLDELTANLPTAYVSSNEYDRRLTQAETRITVIEADIRRGREQGTQVYTDFIKQYSKDNQELRDMIGASKFNAARYALAITIQVIMTVLAVLLAHYLPVVKP
jgi:chromosome segregation ATPase